MKCSTLVSESETTSASNWSQPAKLQKKQCRGVHFGLYGTAYCMPIQQKLTPPVLLFSDFAGWEISKSVIKQNLQKKK